MLPVVGSIMRTCGAFFIRRSIKSCPDAALYKRTLDTYLSTLLAHGAPLEYFIEGGRARDGRIATPKLGLLTSTVDTALADGAKGAACAHACTASVPAAATPAPPRELARICPSGVEPYQVIAGKARRHFDGCVTSRVSMAASVCASLLCQLHKREQLSLRR